jgi:hypothetical protein
MAPAKGRWMLRFDIGELKGKATKTDEGFLRVDAVVTRTGIFKYRNPDGSITRELRHPDEVFSKASLDSMKMIPVTNDHPKARIVDAENAKTFMVGQTGENISPDGRHVMAPLTITHKDAVAAVEGGKRGLSLGYTVDLVKEDGVYNGQRYDAKQTNIRYNHLALVQAGRAGPEARINMDAEDALQTDDDLEENRPMKKVNIDGIEYEAAPEVINALAKQTKRADTAETSLADAFKARDTAATERDSLKTKLDAVTGPEADKKRADEIAAAVKARSALLAQAAKIVKADVALKFDGMSDEEIRKAVITAKFPKTDFTGKDAAYIAGRYDSALEVAIPSDAMARNRERMGTMARGDDAKTDSEKARDDMRESLTNMYKKEPPAKPAH